MLDLNYADLLMFRQAVEFATDGVIMTDIAGNIVYVNRAWQDLTGYTFAEAAGKNPRILKSGKVPPEVFEDMWKTISSGRSFKSEEIVNRRKDGSEFAVQIHVFPVMDGEKILFYVEISQDISERKALEQAKTEFITIASHQLLTPIAVISGYLAMSLSGKHGPVGSGVRPYLNEAQQGANRMARTVKQLLTASRIETGMVKFELTNFDLNEVIKEALSAFSLQIRQKHLSFEHEFTGKITVHADRGQSFEVISNLLNNAINHTVKGGIRILCSIAGGYATVAVTDTGGGIPHTILPHVFDKAFWSKETAVSKADSHGLGLYIARYLVTAMGGIIKADSVVGRGSTFTFTLPLSKIDVHEKNIAG